MCHGDDRSVAGAVATQGKVSPSRWGITAAAILLSIASAISSQSRGGFLTLAVTLLLLLWHSKRKWLVAPVMATGLVLAPLVLPEHWFNRMDTISTSSEEDASAMDRIETGGQDRDRVRAEVSTLRVPDSRAGLQSPTVTGTAPTWRSWPNSGWWPSRSGLRGPGSELFTSLTDSRFDKRHIPELAGQPHAYMLRRCAGPPTTARWYSLVSVCTGTFSTSTGIHHAGAVRNKWRSRNSVRPMSGPAAQGASRRASIMRPRGRSGARSGTLEQPHPDPGTTRT